jgi:hypothetical protein
VSDSRHGGSGTVLGPSSSSAAVVRANHAALRAVCREVSAAERSGRTEIAACQLREVVEANGADFEALAADRVPMRLRPGGRLEVA